MFAVVEIMGHRTRAGVISDTQIGGATLLRIEHPTRADATGDEPLTEYYAAQAIFAIRPCTQDEATAVAEWAWPEKWTASEIDLSFPVVLDACAVDEPEDFEEAPF